MKKLVFLVLIKACVFLFACSSSTDSDDKENKLYAQIQDEDGNVIEGVGLHFYVQINQSFKMHTPSIDKDFEIASMDSGVNPSDYELFQNFPNPFNPQTAIRFNTPIAAIGKLTLINSVDLTHVKTLIDGELAPGMYSVIWMEQMTLVSL